MKRKILLILLLSVSSLLLAAQTKVSPGLSELKFDTSASGRDAWSRLYAMAVIYPDLLYSVKAGEILTEIKQKNPQTVEVFGIVPGSLEEVQKFAKQQKSLQLTLCADKNLTETIKLLGKNFQQSAIFNYSGKLLWAGEAIDLPMMIERIKSGKYSEREEIRIAALVSALQASLRSGNPRMINQSADMVLNVRPEQISAVNAKAFALESSGDIAALEKFFNDRIKRFPQEKSNYFMLIESAFRNPQMSKTAAETALEYFKNFPQDYRGINAICWSLITKQPLDAQALAAACAGEELLTKSPLVEDSRILTTRSLIAYKKCHLLRAIAYGRQALFAAQNANDKAFIADLLKYYDQVRK